MSTIPNLQAYPPQVQPPMYYPNPYGQQAVPQQFNPYATPQVNAVKIDINNPQAYGGQGQQPSPYNVPFAPIYAPVGGQPIPAPAAYAPPIIPANIPAPLPVAPAIPVPVVPAPTPIAAMPAPAPAVRVEEAAVAPMAAEPVAPVTPVTPVQEAAPKADLDVNGLIAALLAPDQDAQTAAIQKIAEVAQADPMGSKALLNEQVFEGLSKVINADTSKLQGPTAESGQNPQALSPLEKAEINKQFGVYTLAILQKNFREEINKEMTKNNLPSISINDLPYIKEGIVDNLKDNPNPTVREACLSALNYLAKPEDKEVLKVLYDISAKHDANSSVKATASDYLSKLPA